MGFPDGATIKSTQSFCPRRHISETAQPDKPIRVIQIVELPEDLDADCFL
jgi:hypothetical protein